MCVRCKLLKHVNTSGELVSVYYLKKEKKRLCVCVAARLFAAIRVLRTNSALFGTALHALLHRWNSRPGVPPLPCPYWPIHFSTGHTITPTILPSLWGPVTREPYIQTNSLSLPSWRDKTPGKTWPWNQTRPSLLLFCESQTFVTYFILAFLT